MKIDGRKIASEVLSEAKKEVDNFKKQGINPSFAIILAGEDPSSESYIKQKIQKAKEVGIETEIFKFKNDASEKTIIDLVYKLNKDIKYQGIIIQRPIFEQLNTAEIYYSITPSKDIDGFLPNSPFDAPIALAVLKIMQTTIPTKALSSKKILVIGKGETAGKPIADFLKKRGLSITIADSKSDLNKLSKNADIIVSAVGKNVIGRSLVSKNSILIGVGIRKDRNGKLQGDYDESEIKDAVFAYTPTPGGVGPVNVAFLLKNVLKAV